MAPRLQLEKAAWRWVETVKPEDITQEHINLAYRINLPACKRGTCRWSIDVSPSHSASFDQRRGRTGGAAGLMCIFSRIPTEKHSLRERPSTMR